MRPYRNRRRGMAVLELILVLGVLLVMAAVVGPRMSRAGQSSPQIPQQLLVGRLKTLRAALDAYAADHGGVYPQGSSAQVAQRLLRCSDVWGRTSAVRSAEFQFGPYLAEIPPLPVGRRAGAGGIGQMDEPSTIGAAWMYNPRAGRIWANADPAERDEAGLGFDSY